MTHVLVDEPIDEGLGARAAVHDFTTGRRHDLVRVETEPTKVA